MKKHVHQFDGDCKCIIRYCHGQRSDFRRKGTDAYVTGFDSKAEDANPFVAGTEKANLWQSGRDHQNALEAERAGGASS